jgi:hypothetical protein
MGSNKSKDAKKLKEDTRRRRGPVIEAVAENVLRKQRSGGNRTGFDHGWPNDTEASSWLDPSRSIAIKMLPNRFHRSAVDGIRGMRRRIGGDPKTSSEAERQRTNGKGNQHPFPSLRNNFLMSPRLHLAVELTTLRDYTTLPTTRENPKVGYITPRKS